MSVIEVFADVRCPFTHVGLRRLVEYRRVRQLDIKLRVRAWPLELVNSMPLDAALIAEEVAELRDQVAPELFVGFDPSRFPESSLPALGLEAAAYRTSLDCGEQVSLLLRDALFEQGRDIARHDELSRIADAAGLEAVRDDAHQVVADWRDGIRRGVIGSPQFFVGSDSFFCPTFTIEQIDGHRRITANEDAFATFLRRCAAA